MLKDSAGRTVDYARISLTDKCNLRCRYCMPASGVRRCEHREILRFEEIHLIIEILKELGVRKFRFTGGEPLVRNGVMDFLENLAPDRFYITTNLAVKGLDMDRLNGLNVAGINISLDTLDEQKYEWLTRGGRLGTVLDNLSRLKLKNVKINTVLIRDFNENEITALIDFAVKTGATIRFIEKMNFTEDGLEYVCLDDVREELIRTGIVEPEGYTRGNSAAVYHKLKKGDGSAGFIMPLSRPFCERCNRIRVKANGDVKMCLFRNGIFNLKELIRSGKNIPEIKRIIQENIAAEQQEEGIPFHGEAMALIGG